MKRKTPGKSSHFDVARGIRPERFSFYYGYVIVFVGTLGVWFSIPGQTIGVSVFTDPVKDALGLTRSEFSNAYAIGTIASSLLLGSAGRWFDRFGARKVAFGAVLGLSMSVALCSLVAEISQSASQYFGWSSTVIGFYLMSVLFFLIRFCGQGVLTMSSRNMIMIWFDQHRGKVNAFTSVALSFGFSSAPLWLNALVERWQWEGAWRTLSLALLGAGALVWLFYRDRPEAHGLLPDGKKRPEGMEPTVQYLHSGRQFTLKEARSTRAFWIYGFVLAFNSFFFTGITFHVMSIFGSMGWDKEKAIALFLPASLVSVSVSTLFNLLSDYVSLKRYLYLMILGGALASTGLYLLDTTAGYILLIVGIGMLGGFFAVLNSIVWPRFYGRTHLGAISGRIQSIVVFSSALAPSLFSWVYAQWGSYRLVSLICGLILLVLALGGLKARNPQPAEFRKRFE